MHELHDDEGDIEMDELAELLADVFAGDEETSIADALAEIAEMLR